MHLCVKATRTAFLIYIVQTQLIMRWLHNYGYLLASNCPIATLNYVAIVSRQVDMYVATLDNKEFVILILCGLLNYSSLTCVT